MHFNAGSVVSPEAERGRGTDRQRQTDVRIYVTINTFTAIVDLSRSNFSIARTPLFQLKSAT